MWRAGFCLMPLAFVELALGKTGWQGLALNPNLFLVQAYCIAAGSVLAFALWNNALRHWPTSQVLLFNNLIPLSTMTWAHFWLGESVTHTFWISMALIAAGVCLGQSSLEKERRSEAFPETEL
jgi:drug/metabolite transporter (DMT)-like permease